MRQSSSEVRLLPFQSSPRPVFPPPAPPRSESRRPRAGARLWLLFACLGLAFLPLLVHAQELRYPHPPSASHGRILYNSGCIACHGPHGNGAALTSTEFKRPGTFPDFTRCDQTTAEPAMQWKAIIVHGGPARGFSTIMPAFGQLLTSSDIDDLVAYLRTFCSNPRWPLGDLNLPRAIVTEKAYPEDEFVLSTSGNVTGAPGFQTHYIHEQRFGVNNQIEIDLPQYNQDQNHQWQSGVGDMTIGLKRVLYANLHSGTIFSLQGGMLAPTGNSKLGYGAGTPTFEPFASFDQLFPTNTWIQFQMGADLPWDTSKSPQSLFYYTALGQSLAADHRLGRLWSPMVEFLATRDLQNGAKTDWDVLPEMQVTLSARQHVRADIGVRTPFTDTAGRSSQLYFYVLWDWQDGKLWGGW